MKPSSHKPRLPRSLSFPIGFVAIRDSLSSVPFLDRLDLGFMPYPGQSAVAFRETLKNKRPHPIFVAIFTKWDKRRNLSDSVLTEEYLEGKWSLWVYPVQRELKPVAAQALEEEGLPKVATWLSIQRPSSWYWGRKECEVLFLPAEERIQVHTSVKAS